MYDKHNRPYHGQLFGNSGINVEGAHLDTFEVEFEDAVPEEKREAAEKVVVDFAGSSDGLGWPREALLTVEVPEGYYNVDELQKRLEKAGYGIGEVRHYFTARLNETHNDPAYTDRFDPDTRRPPGIRF